MDGFCKVRMSALGVYVTYEATRLVYYQIKFLRKVFTEIVGKHCFRIMFNSTRAGCCLFTRWKIRLSQRSYQNIAYSWWSKVKISILTHIFLQQLNLNLNIFAKNKQYCLIGKIEIGLFLCDQCCSTPRGSIFTHSIILKQGEGQCD